MFRVLELNWGVGAVVQGLGFRVRGCRGLGVWGSEVFQA